MPNTITNVNLKTSSLNSSVPLPQIKTSLHPPLFSNYQDYASLNRHQLKPLKIERDKIVQQTSDTCLFISDIIKMSNFDIELIKQVINEKDFKSKLLEIKNWILNLIERAGSHAEAFPISGVLGVYYQHFIKCLYELSESLIKCTDEERLTAIQTCEASIATLKNFIQPFLEEKQQPCFDQLAEGTEKPIIDSEEDLEVITEDEPPSFSQDDLKEATSNQSSEKEPPPSFEQFLQDTPSSEENRQDEVVTHTRAFSTDTDEKSPETHFNPLDLTPITREQEQFPSNLGERQFGWLNLQPPTEEEERLLKSHIQMGPFPQIASKEKKTSSSFLKKLLLPGSASLSLLLLAYGLRNHILPNLPSFTFTRTAALVCDIAKTIFPNIPSCSSEEMLKMASVASVSAAAGTFTAYRLSKMFD